MYRKVDRKGEFPATDLAFGGKLRKDNRWVILSETIPWDLVEEKYSSLLSDKKGRKAYSVRVALGSCIIKEKLKISDEETVEMIRENPYLQFFIGWQEYKDEKPFDSSMMVHFRKRLSADVIKEINEFIINQEIKQKDEDDDSDDSEGSGNKGVLILDATCAPEAMKFPHDITTLDEARRKTEKMIDTLFQIMPAGEIKPRTYRKIARREFLRFIRNRRPKKNVIRKTLRKQLQYVERNLRSIKEISEVVGLTELSRKQYSDLDTIKEFATQQRKLYNGESLESGSRILSISKPHVRAIARGKARAMFEFGAKVSLSMSDGFATVEKLSWNNFNEGCDLIEIVENFKKRNGKYPNAVCADKIYRTRKNLDYCKEHSIRLSGPKLGRPNNNEIIKRAQKRIEKEDEGIRVSIEAKFGEAKTRYTLDRIERRLKETSESAIMMVFLMTNLARIMRSRMREIFVLIYQTIGNWFFTVLLDMKYKGCCEKTV